MKLLTDVADAGPGTPRLSKSQTPGRLSLWAGQFFLLALGLALLLLACRNQPGGSVAEQNPAAPAAPAAGVTPPPASDAAAGPRCLLAAYPDFLTAADNSGVTWKDGTRMVYDDGQTKPDWETTLNRASLKDQMTQCYPVGRDYPNPLPENYEPGRARNEAFFFKMYGASAAEVQRKLVPVVWLPKHLNQRIMVTSVNGINQKLQAVSDELDKLPDEYIKYLQNPGGTFNWRYIAGTTRQSTHSFGATLDINVAHSDYWRNDRPNAQGLYPYKNRIPLEIVEIFERHGFLWGGKWYHYDTMHFEYRPELLADGCTCGKR